MSKTPKTNTKRKTRLKGSDTMKPCAGCGKSKDRFKSFRPRWAGCEKHRTDRGRRYYQKGCDPCDAKVNGNIRQPRCIECDAARPKKRKADAAPTPTPILTAAASTPEPVEPEPETVIEPVVEPEPETVEPEVVGQPEPSAESEDVTPEPAPTAARPKIANTSDLFKLFGDA